MGKLFSTIILPVCYVANKNCQPALRSLQMLSQEYATWMQTQGPILSNARLVRPMGQGDILALLRTGVCSVCCADAAWSVGLRCPTCFQCSYAETGKKNCFHFYLLFNRLHLMMRLWWHCFVNGLWAVKDLVNTGRWLWLNYWRRDKRKLRQK